MDLDMCRRTFQQLQDLNYWGHSVYRLSIHHEVRSCIQTKVPVKENWRWNVAESSNMKHTAQATKDWLSKKCPPGVPWPVPRPQPNTNLWREFKIQAVLNTTDLEKIGLEQWAKISAKCVKTCSRNTGNVSNQLLWSFLRNVGEYKV